MTPTIRPDVFLSEFDNESLVQQISLKHEEESRILCKPQAKNVKGRPENTVECKHVKLLAVNV